MLTHLRISAFAILDDVSLDLGPGLNVLTGETGAGKSLLVDAVALLRGGRASSEVVRAGADEARIEAVFEPEGPAARALAARLAKAGLLDEEGPGGQDGGPSNGATSGEANAPPRGLPEGLIVRRVIGRAAPGKAARSRVHINGSISTAAVLGEVVSDLIDLAGQHEHQKLMDPAAHQGTLDDFGRLGHGLDGAHLDEMAAAFAALTTAAESLRALSLDERQRAEREDFLRFQVSEIDEAHLRPGEDAECKQLRERLRSAEKLLAAARRAEQVIYSRESSIVDELGGVARELSETGRADAALGKLGAQVEDARVSLADAAESLRRYADHLHADPERLAEIDDRLHLISRLTRKHGADVAEILRKRDQMAAELANLGSHETRRTEAEAALVKARARTEKAASALRAGRRQAAEALAERVSTELSGLGMAGATLRVDIADRAAREGDDEALVFEGRRVAATGWDKVELLLCANVGEEARPLARVASGGELSRIMLALKRVLARADVVGTYVFDEVDAGIGGSVADVVGRQLQKVARDKQVLCVTHLPQIAAYADAHFHVEKRAEGGRTRTVVRTLTLEERVEELARMVGGARGATDKARAHAEDLIRHAKADDKAQAKRARK